MKFTWKAIRFWFQCRGAIAVLIAITFWWSTSNELGAFQLCGAILLLELIAKFFVWRQSSNWANAPVDQIEFAVKPEVGEYAGKTVSCTYQFKVNGANFRGDCICPFRLKGLDEDEIENRIHEIRSVSSVFYWPKNPEFCLLEKANGRLFLKEFIVAIVIWGIFGVAFLLVWPNVS